MKVGWRALKIGDLYQIGSSKRVLKSQWKTEGVPFYRGREITRLATDGFVENALFISEDHFTELARGYGVPKPGDIVITAIGTIGNAHVVRENDRFYFKDASVLWMKRIGDVSSAFMNLWLKSHQFYDQLDRGNGATVDTLTIQKLQSLRIDLPPAIEQRRIVKILDEAFAGIAEAKARAEQNRQNARALFENHLNAIFSGSSRDWLTTTIGETCVLKSGTTVPRALERPSGDIPYLKVADMSVSGNADIIRTSSRFLERAGISDSSIIPAGATIFPKRGGAILTNKKRLTSVPICADLNIMAVIPSARVDARLLYYYFLNVDMRKLGTGSSIPQINNYDIAPLHISFPASIPVQRRLADDLAGLHRETRLIESLYARKLAALDELKASLLHEAFSGRL